MAISFKSYVSIHQPLDSYFFDAGNIATEIKPSWHKSYDSFVCIHKIHGKDNFIYGTHWDDEIQDNVADSPSWVTLLIKTKEEAKKIVKIIEYAAHHKNSDLNIILLPEGAIEKTTDAHGKELRYIGNELRIV